MTSEKSIVENGCVCSSLFTFCLYLHLLPLPYSLTQNKACSTTVSSVASSHRQPSPTRSLIPTSLSMATRQTPRPSHVAASRHPTNRRRFLGPTRRTNPQNPRPQLRKQTRLRGPRKALLQRPRPGLRALRPMLARVEETLHGSPLQRAPRSVLSLRPRRRGCANGSEALGTGSFGHCREPDRNADVFHELSDMQNRVGEKLRR